MRIQKISKEQATVWFSRAELGFMIAATERALKELHVDEFDTRTGRTIGYAKGVLAGLRVANGERAIPQVPQAGDRVPNSKEIDTSSERRVTIRVERVTDDKALVSLSDHELRFLNNAINEAINGIRGDEEFEQISGKPDEYGEKLMRQLQAANDKVQALS